MPTRSLGLNFKEILSISILSLAILRFSKEKESVKSMYFGMTRTVRVGSCLFGEFLITKSKCQGFAIALTLFKIYLNFPLE